jgi:isoleucyl-tRNA synthetase
MENRGRELLLEGQEARFPRPTAMVAFRKECRAYATHWLNVQR